MTVQFKESFVKDLRAIKGKSVLARVRALIDLVEQAQHLGQVANPGAEEVAFMLTHGQVIERYDEDFPLPSVLLNGHTAANRPLHVVVGINVDEQTLIIITTYEPEPLQWADNFSRRIL